MKNNNLLDDEEVRAHLAKLRAEYERARSPMRKGEKLISNKPRKCQSKAGRGPPKIITTIRLSADVLTAFRATGRGWQTRMDAVLRHVVADEGLVELLSTVPTPGIAHDSQIKH